MSGRKGAKGRDSCIMPFHSFIPATLVAGSLSLQGSPAGLSLRAATEADAWAHFRLRSLRFRIHVQSAANPRAAGWIGGVEDSPPTTISQVMELLPSTYHSGAVETVPSSWVHVPKSDLAGPFPWYKTVNGSADTTEESPGSLVVVGTLVEVVTLEVYGIFEFKTSLATANTPMLVALRQRVRKERLELQMAREKSLLVTILQSGGSSTGVVNGLKL